MDKHKVISLRSGMPPTPNPQSRSQSQPQPTPLNLNGQQFTVDLSKAKQKVCECGCKLFISAVQSYTVSALMSPVGQELTANVPALVCRDCGKVLG